MKYDKHVKKIIVAVLFFLAIMVTGVVVLAHDGALFKPSKPKLFIFIFTNHFP